MLAASMRGLTYVGKQNLLERLALKHVHLNMSFFYCSAVTAPCAVKYILINVFGREERVLEASKR